MQTLLNLIVSNHHLHAKWLNTLSYLENCGARKIAACEHPTLVKEEVLKHAHEEFRHAHYLKKQIKKVSADPFPDYSLPLILGGISTLNYLNALDIFVSRIFPEAAYLLVTYAIEMRAKELYPLYHQVLRAHSSKVHVKSIILEEEEHLAEMRSGIATLSQGVIYANKAQEYEKQLFDKWIKNINKDVCK